MGVFLVGVVENEIYFEHNSSECLQNTLIREHLFM